MAGNQASTVCIMLILQVGGIMSGASFYDF